MAGEAQRRSSTPRSRSRNRKPLSDLTNTVSQPQSSQSSSATVTASKTKLKLIREPERKPKDPSAALLRFRSSSLTGDGNCDVSEIRADINKRQTARKASSCYPAERLGNVRGKRNEHGDMGILELCTVPRKKMQRCSKLKQDASLQDFIQQQRAYFNEIDAFELSEEEVASGNELD